MRLLLRILRLVLLAIGAARMAAYLAYAATILPSPLEASHLEAKMVLLAYRAEVGASLYPDWRTYPHVANFFGPVYFGLTGLIGSWLGADIRGLFLIGRAISFTSCLLTSFVLGVWIARRYGRGAGLSGAVLSLGAVPLYGFSVMVRPDLLAELLGLVGFILTTHPGRSARLAGCAALILAVLTKQTSVVFLLAAAIALFAEGRRRQAMGVLVGCLGVLVLVVLAIGLVLEPNLVAALLGEGKTPWSRENWLTILRLIGLGSPDLFLIPLIGLGIWLGQGREIGPYEVRAAALTVVLVTASLGLSCKQGADSNYYLSLRAAEALAVGALWQASATSTGRGRSSALLVAALLAILSLIPGTLWAAIQAQVARGQALFLEGPSGRAVLSTHQRIINVARDPDARLLTDSGLFDLYQGRRAVFGDPWLFRMLVETGQVRPSRMLEMIDAQEYDLIVTHDDIFSRTYESYQFGLPMVLIERARQRYEPIGREAGLFLYGRRRGTGSP